MMDGTLANYGQFDHDKHQVWCHVSSTVEGQVLQQYFEQCPGKSPRFALEEGELRQVLKERYSILRAESP